MSPLDCSLSSTAALTAAWRFVDGGFGYSAPQLFVLVLDRRARVAGPVIQLYDEHQAAAPEDELLGLLVERLAETLKEQAPGGGVALMKARPGHSSVLTAADLRWCRALHRHLQAAPFSSRPLFFASDAGPRIVAPDELIG
ncbi:hypothetical protein QE370_003241 [Aeromicrobium sp. SORGH_AS981]|uniref:hypothetical protein n=1 Tax=Aeromicrobium sp. SORGH_AS_0981 TaxID=3041802 RepID=UPI002861586F|nr:hypothetical protein [Aeromicrobium sp. SORGH_AS_0981]MDR6120057.1 hypothetical protein [Aeromicrobium sp. SORGH_AS_0981]